MNLCTRPVLILAVALAASASPLAAQRAPVVREVKDAPAGGTSTVRIATRPALLVRVPVVVRVVAPIVVRKWKYRLDRPPVIVVNGRIAVTPDFHVNDVESVDFLKAPWAVAEYGPGAKHGAIVITTKRRRVLVP